MLDQRSLLGVSLMVLVAGFSAVDAVLVRFLSGEVHPVVMAFTRAAFGALAMLPWILSRPGIMRTSRHWLHVLRATLKLGSLIALFAILGNDRSHASLSRAGPAPGNPAPHPPGRDP